MVRRRKFIATPALGEGIKGSRGADLAPGHRRRRELPRVNFRPFFFSREPDFRKSTARKALHIMEGLPTSIIRIRPWDFRSLKGLKVIMNPGTGGIGKRFPQGRKTSRGEGLEVLDRET